MTKSAKISNQDAKKLMYDLMELYKDLLIPFMKVRRDVPFPTEPERQETDGEHAFTLAMLAITINERMNFKLDNGLIAQYALVHDLVEAHAGDVSARASSSELAKKAAREHEAFLLIKSQFETTTPWIPKLIHKYESRESKESRFVYAVDKLIVAMARMVGDGAGWMDYYPEPDGSQYRRVVALLRSKTEAFPELLELFDTIHDELDKRRVDYIERDSQT